MKPRRITQIFTAVMACWLIGCDREKTSELLYRRNISELEVRYMGDRSVEEKRLRAFIVSKPGDRFTKEMIDTNVKLLYESGLVDDVRFLSEPDGHEVRLIAEVSAHIPSGPPFFTGNTVYSDKILAKASGLTKGLPNTIEELEEAQRKLKAYYVDHGYLDTEVVCRAFQGGDPSPEDYIFVIHEGHTVPQISTE